MNEAFPNDFVTKLNDWLDNPYQHTYALGRTVAWEPDSQVRNRLTELAVMDAFFEAADLTESVQADSLKTIQNDPPDVSFHFIDGRIVGVEVSELVDGNWRAALRKEAQTNPNQLLVNYKIYSDVEYERSLIHLIRKKSKIVSRDKWSENYAESWLVIHTGEPDLEFRAGKLSKQFQDLTSPFDKIFILGAAIPNPHSDGQTEIAWGEITFGARA